MSETKQTKVYSTGELAAACGVSVRTVQYYDEKGLMPPAQITEGGRRVYTEEDAAKLRKILLLKSLGLQLNAIRGVLDSEVSSQVLVDILCEQDRKLERELEERQAARAAIERLTTGLEQTGELPVESIADMEDMMQQEQQEKNLQRVYNTMLAVAAPIGVAETAGLIHWIRKGDWKPFAAIELLLGLPAAFLVTRYYRDNVAYLCPHCHEVFQPETREWFFALHTPTTRKVTCTSCGENDWCTEVSIEKLGKSEPAMA